MNDISKCILKASFKSEEGALSKLLDIQDKDKNTRLKRFYKCTRCKEYHLTSMELVLTNYDLSLIKKNHIKEPNYKSAYKGCYSVSKKLIESELGSKAFFENLSKLKGIVKGIK